MTNLNSTFKGIHSFTSRAMCRLVPLLAVLFVNPCSSSLAQSESLYSLTVSEYATDIVPGQTTYRLYVDLVNSDDFMSSVYGNQNDPMELNTDSGFYNDAAGTGSTAAGINPFFFNFFPSLEADSWLTIGIESQPTGDQVGISTIEDSDQPYLSSFAAGSALDGENILINTLTGGAWWVLFGVPNGLGNDNGQVLVMQITTAGSLSGLFNVQIFGNGDGETDIRKTFAFDGVGTFYDAADETGGPDPIDGCTDSTACNYSSEATNDDGSCTYADAGYDCDGNCLADIDADGICDEFEIGGCAAFNACNYDSSATDDDGSCDFCSCASDNPPANGYALSIEVHSVDLVPGYTTYRVYQNLVNSDDFVSSVYGNNDDPLSIATTTGFFNSTFGGTTAGAVNPAFLTFFPELGADSWVTIGIESQAVGSEVDISVAESQDQPWVSAFAANSAMDGQDIEMSDFTGGAWYVLNGTPNGLGGDDNRVLLMQLSTTGEMSGVINTQIFGAGLGENDIRNTYTFNGVGDYTADGGGVILNACGCTDVEALNYDNAADYDDGSCIYSILGCMDDVACNFDESATNDDGNCEYLSCLIFGCTNTAACNYNEYADFEDGSCVFAEINQDCDGNCLVDDDGDGVCDQEEIGGCTDPMACNYNLDATDDDASCDFCSCFSAYTLIVAEHATDLVDGMTTYRFYQSMVHEDDFLSAVYGNSDASMSLNVSDGFYNDAFGGATAASINPILFSSFPDLMADSWVTIGIESLPTGSETDILTTQSSNQPWMSAFTAGAEQDGQSFILDDEGGGAWYILNGSTNGLPDENGRVLLMQLTTAGSISGILNTQVFEHGFGGASQYNRYAFNGVGEFYLDDHPCGCMDSEASNYLPTAIYDAGNCSYAVYGCTDSGACNFQEEATDDDASCAYPDEGYDCNGDCISDSDQDGICDEFEVVGCTDVAACNYEENATDESANCDYCSCEPEYSLTIEEYATDVISGTTTYRFYQNLENENDFVSSVFGNSDSPLELSTDVGFYNSVYGGTTANAINPLLVGSFPEISADSWVTIGIESQATGNQSVINVIESSLQPWIVAFSANSELDGQNISISDITGGSWYVLNGTPNGLGGDDNRVLIMQLTTSGGFSGIINTQVFGNGSGQNDIRNVFVFDGVGQFTPNGQGAVNECGCTDAEASNYDAEAQFDDQSCEYLSLGCTEEGACNYDSGAAQDDGSCEYPSAGYDCNSTCLSDEDGDGICDAFEILGCSDPNALNYNPLSTDDDTCDYGPGWIYNATPISGILLGNITIDGAIAEEQDWIGAFTPDGICAGVTQPISFNGLAYISLVIYGDDAATPDVVEGMIAGLPFSLHFFDASTNSSYVFYENDGDSLLSGWSNTNGSPLPDYSDPYQEFAFSSTPPELSCGDPVACNYESGGGDISPCIYPDLGYDCDGNCLEDLDSDGICDGIDDCIGSLDFCDVCNGPGAIYECGCYDIPEGDCDCSGGQPDLFGDCPDDCELDSDLDGICDDIDPCVGTLDVCGICNGPGPVDGYDCNGNCISDCDNDGVCDAFETLGCSYSGACNYEENATDDDGSCTYADAGYDCNGDCLVDMDGDQICDQDEITGCQDDSACNYDEAATDAGYCDYADAGYDCDGNCLNDADQDGVCDEFEVAGCTSSSACNYSSAATDDNGSCTYADAGYDCNGDCLVDTDGDQICDQDEITGCQDGSACNYDVAATDAGYCDYADAGYDCDGNCLNDADQDGVCDEFEVAGCTSSSACNYSSAATDDNGSCTYADAGYDCNGDCLVDTDGDQICDQDEITGCQDGSACNYDVAATDAGYCDYADAGYDCDGNCLNDADQDGICDEFEVAGCTSSSACNYSSNATDDNGSCTYADAGYDCNGDCLVDTDGDQICDQDEITGCQAASACNYDVAATDAGYCDYADAGYDCDGNCLNDADQDGICDEFEVAGCIDSSSCNYSSAATDDNGSCTYADAGYDCNGDCLVDTDGDQICDQDEITGCQDDSACNYDVAATDAGYCDYADAGYDCDGNCLNDADQDGICDEFEVAGCTSSSACNYSSAATDDNGSCTYADAGYDCNGDCLVDTDGDQICDQDEITGCQDDSACNYDEAGTDAGYCDYADAGYDCDGNCLNDADQDGICDEYQSAVDEYCNNLFETLTAALANGDYCGDGTVWVEEWSQCVAIPSCYGDLDLDGNRGTEDLLLFLAVYNTSCPIFLGCTDPEADNYDPFAEIDDESCIISFDPCQDQETLTYYGTTYALKAIGEQCWFEGNLGTPMFQNGDSIPYETSSAAWYAAGISMLPACASVNGDIENTESFGFTYNGFAINDDRGLCPTGWHVPSDADWMALEFELGMDSLELADFGNRGTDQGLQLKASEFDVPAWDGTNSAGFDALASGQRFSFGSFSGFGTKALYWTNSNSGSSNWVRKLESANDQIERGLISGSFGGSVRCIKDAE